MNLWNIYIDEGIRAGNVSRDWMLLLAKASITAWIPGTEPYEYGSCNIAYANEIGSWGEEMAATGCLPGKVLRDKIYEMFGEDVQFVENEVIIESFPCSRLIYKNAGDEFVRFEAIEGGCGGTDTSPLVRVLIRAEMDAEYLYLYEKVLAQAIDDSNGVVDMRNKLLRHIGADEVQNGEIVLPFDAYEVTDEYLQQVTVEQGDLYKWTFRKTDDGNYVFESLKPVEE